MVCLTDFFFFKLMCPLRKTLLGNEHRFFLMIITNQLIFEGKKRVCERVKTLLYRLNDLRSEC